VTDAAADQLPVFRRVRDHLRLRVEALLALLPTLTADQR
jgi:hypothetical protein